MKRLVALGPQRIGSRVGWVGAPIGVSASGYYSTATPDHVWDGDINTDWNTGSTSPAWTIADFGSPVTANRIGVASTSVARTWDLSGSNDNSSWTSILTTVNAPVQGTLAYTSFASIQTWRYWKMYASSGAWTDPRTFNLEMA